MIPEQLLSEDAIIGRTVARVVRRHGKVIGYHFTDGTFMCRGGLFGVVAQPASVWDLHAFGFISDDELAESEEALRVAAAKREREAREAARATKAHDINQLKTLLDKYGVADDEEIDVEALRKLLATEEG